MSQEDDLTRYRCVITDGDDTVISDAAVLHVLPVETIVDGMTIRLTEDHAEAFVSSWQGGDARLVIPSQVIIGGVTWSVTGIADAAFPTADELWITIPSSVVQIGDQAFSE